MTERTMISTNVEDSGMNTIYSFVLRGSCAQVLTILLNQKVREYVMYLTFT